MIGHTISAEYEEGAFVGVSLDSNQFSREWIRSAIRYILSRHKTITFVLGSRLLTFNKCTSQDSDGTLRLDLASADTRISKRLDDVQHLLKSEIVRLSRAEQSRVSIRIWDDYADLQFVNAARILSIAYATIDSFRACVDRDVDVHFAQQTPLVPRIDAHRRLSALYVVEETAMIIRITEEGHPYEYYPQHHIHTLTELYEDKFAQWGLRVEDLTGHAKTRVFSSLPLLAAESGA